MRIIWMISAPSAEGDLEAGGADPRSDEELLCLAGRGDEAAFFVIYERHKARVLRFAQKLVQSEQDALDVVQETFLYLFRKAPSYEPRARLTTLIYKVVRSLSITAARKRRKHGGVPAEDLPLAAAGDAPDGGAEQEDELRTVREALATLPEIYREVLHLRLVEDLPLQEIAEITDVPVGTVKSRIHNGIARLREALDRRKAAAGRARLEEGSPPPPAGRAQAGGGSGPAGTRELAGPDGSFQDE